MCAVLHETETHCFHNLYQWPDEAEWITIISARPVLGQKIPIWQSGRIDTGDGGPSLRANLRRGDSRYRWKACRLVSHGVFSFIQHMAMERKLQAKRKVSIQSSPEHQILLI